MTASSPTIDPPARTESRRQRAKALFAQLRHRQLLLAMAGRVGESATYARRALRVRRAACPS